MITPASNYDGTVAIPLIKQFFQNYNDTFKPLYYAMDSANDLEDVYRYIVKEQQGVPIIAYNPRGSYAPPEGLDEEFIPICSRGYKLIYWVKDGNYLKFRCPHAVGKCDYPHGMNWMP